MYRGAYRCVKDPIAAALLLHSCGYTAVLVSTRSMVQHDTDTGRWRNPQNAEVRRQYPTGVPLGSTIVKEKAMREEQEELLARKGGEMHSKIMHSFAVGIAFFLIVLQLLPDYVEPNPSPEYVPYTEPPSAPPTKEASS